MALVVFTAKANGEVPLPVDDALPCAKECGRRWHFRTEDCVGRTVLLCSLCFVKRAKQHAACRTCFSPAQMGDAHVLGAPRSFPARHHLPLPPGLAAAAVRRSSGVSA